MAVYCRAVADGLLLTLSLTLLGWGAEGQGNGRGRKEVPGSTTVYLGQDRDIWRPLIHTTVNLSEISSIGSSFQIQTFDPEGVIFYGDTKYGEDWFVLSLKDGIPLMEISKEGVHVSVAGGPKINDGKWHTMEISNMGKFVILNVDGSSGLVVGLETKEPEEVLSVKLRLALGGILINKEKLIVEFEPQMDGCVREGSWLDLSDPWETEAEELWPCYQNIQPGSYFPGTGFAIFNTSVIPIDTDGDILIEVFGDFSQMNGTILSIKPVGQELLAALVVNNNTNEITHLPTNQKDKIIKNQKKLVVKFPLELLQVKQEEAKLSVPHNTPVKDPVVLTRWRDGRLAVGGYLGEDDDDTGSQFLTGCLEKIRVQGKDLDLDLAIKHSSISSHSCPA